MSKISGAHPGDKHLKEAPLWLALALLTNIRLGQKSSQGTNAIAYFASLPVPKRASKLERFSTISLNRLVLYLKLGQLLRWSTVRSPLEKVLLSFASIRIGRENLSVKNTAAYFDRYFSDEKKV